MKHSVRRNRKLIVAGLAVKQLGAVDEPYSILLAADAFGAIGPAKTL